MMLSKALSTVAVLWGGLCEGGWKVWAFRTVLSHQRPFLAGLAGMVDVHPQCEGEGKTPQD